MPEELLRSPRRVVRPGVGDAAAPHGLAEHDGRAQVVVALVLVDDHAVAPVLHAAVAQPRLDVGEHLGR